MCSMLQPYVPQVAVQLLAAPELLGETSLLLRWQLLGTDGQLARAPAALHAQGGWAVAELRAALAGKGL